MAPRTAMVSNVTARLCFLCCVTLWRISPALPQSFANAGHKARDNTAVDSAAAAELLEGDLGQAQFELQQLTDKRASWAELCSLKQKESKDWRECMAVLDAGQYQVREKEAQIAEAQRRLDLLAASVKKNATATAVASNMSATRQVALLGKSKQGLVLEKSGKNTTSEKFSNGSQPSSMLQSGSEEAVGALAGDKGRAELELEQLETKKQEWSSLCKESQTGPTKVSLLHKSSARLARGATRNAQVSVNPEQAKDCLKVVAGIEGSIVEKQKEIASYQKAMDSLKVIDSMGDLPDLDLSSL